MLRFDFEKPISELEEKLKRFKESSRITKKTTPEIKERRIRMLNQHLQTVKKEIYSNLNGWQKVLISRHPDRPFTLDYIENITEEFIELHGDRNAGDDKAIVGGLARINGQTIMLIGQQKGRTTKENQYRNFGMANPDGYRKALRLMKLAEKFNKPIVTFIDTPGASTGLKAEERGQAQAIATNLQEMVMLKVPVICIIIGEGGSGGALGIGVGDKVQMMEYTWYSVITPEACSSILWQKWNKKEQAAIAMKLTPEELLNFKIIDGIIKEPLGGAHNDPDLAFKYVKKDILKQLEKLNKLSAEDRIKSRIKKFSKIGIFEEVPI